MLKDKWITKNQNTRLYQIPVPVIGLTGGISSGKSTVSELFKKKNIPIIDADKLVKNIYQKETTISFINNNFPQVIENKNIVFPKLREMAFTAPKVKKQLEDYIYALLPAEFTSEFQKLPPASFIIYDVPLMFERGLEQFLDCTICVYAPRSIQVERLIKRDNLDPILAEKILNQQMDIEDKKRISDLVISNIGNLDNLQIEFDRIFSELTA